MFRVCANRPGYLPDVEPTFYASREDAFHALFDELAENDVPSSILYSVTRETGPEYRVTVDGIVYEVSQVGPDLESVAERADLSVLDVALTHDGVDRLADRLTTDAPRHAPYGEATLRVLATMAEIYSCALSDRGIII